MAPKYKSTSSRNPLRSGAASSSPSTNSNPSHVQFHDEKAQQDFFKNFQKHGIHLERHIILLNFSNTPLPSIIRT